MKNKYTFSENIANIYSLLLTKMFFPGSRLIRRPIYIRGKKSLVLGKRLTTGRMCRIDLNGEKKSLFIGDNCQIGDYTHIVAHERVEIGDNCLIASKVFISDTSHGLYDNSQVDSRPNIAPNDRQLVTNPVKIGNNVWLGENVVVLLGAEIGDGCIIGANSVITKKIPSNSIVVGNNRIIKRYNEESEKWEKQS